MPLSLGRSLANKHDGDWKYYKQRAFEQRDVIGQLASLLETHGYDLPKVSRQGGEQVPNPHRNDKTVVV